MACQPPLLRFIGVAPQIMDSVENLLDVKRNAIHFYPIIFLDRPSLIDRESELRDTQVSTKLYPTWQLKTFNPYRN